MDIVDRYRVRWHLSPPAPCGEGKDPAKLRRLVELKAASILLDEKAPKLALWGLLYSPKLRGLNRDSSRDGDDGDDGGGGDVGSAALRRSVRSGDSRGGGDDDGDDG